MAKNTLVIMAAGLGSRYGGIKQLEAVGPSGEIIMDYSIFDAIEAGFDKVIFITRRDIEKEFKEVIGNRISKFVEVEYVFQDIDNLPDGFSKPSGRNKPWGTGQAILSCVDAIKEPFAVINADDYYGKEAFVKIYEYLNRDDKESKDKYDFCMAGFILGNTLSDNGTVARGVCKVNEDLELTNIVETFGIERKGESAIALDSKGKEIQIDLDAVVSMNMWGFTPEILPELEAGFIEFLNKLNVKEENQEYLLPVLVDKIIKSGKATVKVLNTNDKWFGVTYKEDKNMVIECFKKLVAEGVYPKKLF